MKRLGIVLAFVFLAGCQYSSERIKTYIDDPKTILEDPLSVEHQEAIDALERDYLQKKITYADYLDGKRQLEEDYSRGVQGRRDIIESPR